MNINFTDIRMKKCQEVYNALDPEDRITMSHFELARETEITELEAWIEFLKDTRVAEAINEELVLFQAAQQRKLIARATTHDKSVGTAQMINALGKALESNDENKGGTVMIYSYVPMNDKEQNAPNTVLLDHDIFERNTTHE